MKKARRIETKFLFTHDLIDEKRRELKELYGKANRLEKELIKAGGIRLKINMTTGVAHAVDRKQSWRTICGLMGTMWPLTWYRAGVEPTCKICLKILKSSSVVV